MRKILTSQFFNRSTLSVAKDMLGKFLVRRIGKKEIKLMITEVEAYDGPKDKASHAHCGKTERNKVMFGEAGNWYIYFTYGMHWMLNIVTGSKGYPAAVLIRGVVPYQSPRTNYSRKNKAKLKNKKNKLMWMKSDLVRETDRITGPARITKYLKINKKFNAKPANKKTGLWIEDRPACAGRGVKIKPSMIKASKRIGVAYASEWANKPYRFNLRHYT